MARAVKRGTERFRVYDHSPGNGPPGGDSVWRVTIRVSKFESRRCEMTTRKRAPRTPVVAAMFGMLLWAAAARADEEKAIRPKLEQMVQTLAEKLEAAADKLELTADQRSKIREIHATYAEQFKGLRTERRSLLGEELKALGAILARSSARRRR